MFNQLQGNGRVWIYTSNRALSSDEQTEINKTMDQFLAQWAAHGNALKAGFEIFHNQLLVLAVDEDFEGATGCSIDTSVQVFRELDQKYQVDLFNRMNLAFYIADQVKLIEMAKLNTAFQSGEISSDTPFFNNTISSLEELRTNWKTPLKNSWAFSRIKQLA